MNCPKCGNEFDENIAVCPSCHDFFNRLVKSGVKKRYYADIIDFFIVFIFYFIHPYMLFIGAFYILLRDNLTKYGSVGKMVMKLNILDINKKTRALSKQRLARNFIAYCLLNLILLVSFGEIIPWLGLIFKLLRFVCMVAGAVYVALELYYIYYDEKGQTLSDRLSKTMIV